MSKKIPERIPIKSLTSLVMSSLNWDASGDKLYELITTYRDLAQAISQLIRPIAEELDLTVFQVRVLTCLSPEEMNLTELAEKTHSHKSYASATVEQLVQLEMIQRAYSASDRRNVHLSITEEGLHVVEQLFGKSSSFYERLSSAFNFPDEHLQRLTEMHRKVICNLAIKGANTI